jgi:type III secretion system FlhB-like substrate exporter
MRELGETAETLHRELGDYLARHALKPDLVVLVGTQAAHIADKALYFPDAATAAGAGFAPDEDVVDAEIVDDEIPQELYQAVADILVFVYRQKGRLKPSTT